MVAARHPPQAPPSLSNTGKTRSRIRCFHGLGVSAARFSPPRTTSLPPSRQSSVASGQEGKARGHLPIGMACARGRASKRALVNAIWRSKAGLAVHTVQLLLTLPPASDFGLHQFLRCLSNIMKASKTRESLRRPGCNNKARLPIQLPHLRQQSIRQESTIHIIKSSQIPLSPLYKDLLLPLLSSLLTTSSICRVFAGGVRRATSCRSRRTSTSTTPLKGIVDSTVPKIPPYSTTSSVAEDGGLGLRCCR